MIQHLLIFTFRVSLKEEVLVIGQIKVVRSCQLKRDLPALEHSLQLRKTGGEELRIVKMAKLHLCRRSKCISFFLAKKKKKEQPNPTIFCNGIRQNNLVAFKR